ncbi:MAG: Ig-like domain-containing protein, partial [Lachnospiraceae bacterium]|nr:Ig-like domain-containing protein [Lachnospiraceae bacterium]
YLYSQYFSDFAIVYATEKTYYVNIDLGNGESIQKIVGEDDGIELPANISKDGFSFGGLYKDAEYKDAWNNTADKVKEDTTLYAKWNKSVTGVTVDKDNVSFTTAGETSQITVNVLPADADNKKVTFTSSDPNVASVDANGLITAVASGTADIIVTTEDGAKTATIKVTVEIPEIAKQGVTEPTKEEKAVISMNAGLKISQTGSKINIKWGKVAEADGYDVYVTYCGESFAHKKPAKTINKNTTVKANITKINGKKINLKKNFKLYVAAYKMVDGNKEILAKTITGHVVGRKNTKYSNAKNIKITSKTKVSLKQGKTSKIKAKTVLVEKGKKQLSNAHAKEFRYASSNNSIATVDKKGKVKGVAKGTCTIYVYARNGYAKKIKVTVK